MNLALQRALSCAQLHSKCAFRDTARDTSAPHSTLPGMTEPSYTLRSRNLDGTHNETDGLTAEQAAKLDCSVPDRPKISG